MNMQCQIAIAEAEPIGRSDLAELFKGVPGLTGETPAAFTVTEVSECVEKSVVVWADGEPVQLKVVSRVRNDGEVSRGERSAKAVGELRSADTAGKESDAWAHAVREGSTSRPKAAAHSAWLRPTLCR